jgi:ketosteroid isomerase-like protein
MSRAIVCAGWILSAISIGAASASPRTGTGGTPTASVETNPLEPIGWMVGGTWMAEEKSDSGGPLTVKLVCKWGKTRNTILYNVEFGSGASWAWQYDGMFAWSPEKKKIVMRQVNRKGELAEGELTAGGNEMDQVVRAVHPDGGMHFLKSHYTRIDADSFRFKAYFRATESAEWQDALDVVYRRQNPVTAEGPQPSVTLPPELARVLADYEIAWSKGDRGALARLFTEDGFALQAGSPLVRGRENIGRREGAGSPLSLRALAYATSGDVGYIVGAYTDHPGAPDRGRFTLTLKRDASGRWLILSDMDN